MEEREFIIEALGYLAKLFPEMDKRLETDEQLERWLVRFGHLDVAAWERAVNAYADDNHFPPTVNKLMEYLPESMRTKTGKPKEASDYTRPGAYQIFTPTTSVEADTDFVPDWAELYRQLNAREWGMDDHNKE